MSWVRAEKKKGCETNFKQGGSKCTSPLFSPFFERYHLSRVRFLDFWKASPIFPEIICIKYWIVYFFHLRFTHLCAAWNSQRILKNCYYSFTVYTHDTNQGISLIRCQRIPGIFSQTQVQKYQILRIQSKVMFLMQYQFQNEEILRDALIFAI